MVIDVLQALDDNWYEGKKYYPKKATEDLKEGEGILIPLPDAQGVAQQTACVYKSGVFHLIGNSRKPSALKFQEWLRREVLPEIDERGSYTAPGAVVRAPTNMREALLLALSEMEQKETALGQVRQLQIRDKENQKVIAEVTETKDMALRAATEVIVVNHKLEAKIEADKDKVDFANRLEAEDRGLLLRDALKLCTTRIQEGRARELLIAEHYIYPKPRGSHGKVEYFPLASQIDNGRFRVRPREGTNANGDKYNSNTLEVRGDICSIACAILHRASLVDQPSGFSGWRSAVWFPRACRSLCRFEDLPSVLGMSPTPSPSVNHDRHLQTARPQKW